MNQTETLTSPLLVRSKTTKLSISERFCLCKNNEDRILSYNEWISNAFYSMKNIFENQEVAGTQKLATLLKLRAMLDTFISMTYENNQSARVEISRIPPTRILPLEFKIFVDGTWIPAPKSPRIRPKR
jgi:hypothetical protein